MLVDWFTVTAQIVNFLVLVALLRFFLYRPLVEAMDRRQQSVSSRWEEAESRRREAEEEAEAYRRTKQEFEDAHEEALAASREEVKQVRQELIQQARDDTDRLRREWRAALRREQRVFLDELRRRAVQETFSVSRRVLADLADAELERRILETFVRRIESLEEQDRRKMSDVDLESALVRSGFSVPDDVRPEIEAALARCLSEDIDVRFEVASDLVCGVEVVLGSHKISWEIGDYLGTLEEEVIRTLEEESAGRGSASDGHLDGAVVRGDRECLEQD